MIFGPSDLGRRAPPRIGSRGAVGDDGPGAISARRGDVRGPWEVDAEMNVRRIAGRGAGQDPSLTRTHFTGSARPWSPELISRACPGRRRGATSTGWPTWRAIHDGREGERLPAGRLLGRPWERPRSLLRAHLDLLEGAPPPAPLPAVRGSVLGFASRRGPGGVRARKARAWEAPLRGAHADPGGGRWWRRERTSARGVVIGARAGARRFLAPRSGRRAVLWEGNARRGRASGVVEQIAAPRRPFWKA